MNQNKIILDHIRKHLLEIVANEDVKGMDPEALLVEIAVERLPVWINEIKTDADTDIISRKAALDALEGNINAINARIQKCLESGMFVTRGTYRTCKTQVLDDIETIKDLPPAQPELRCKMDGKE